MFSKGIRSGQWTYLEPGCWRDSLFREPCTLAGIRSKSSPDQDVVSEFLNRALTTLQWSVRSVMDNGAAAPSGKSLTCLNEFVGMCGKLGLERGRDNPSQQFGQKDY